MPPEVVKAACDQAHALGLPVAAHVEPPRGPGGPGGRGGHH